MHVNDWRQVAIDPHLRHPLPCLCSLVMGILGLASGRHLGGGWQIAMKNLQTIDLPTLLVSTDQQADLRVLLYLFGERGQSIHRVGRWIKVMVDVLIEHTANLLL